MAITRREVCRLLPMLVPIAAELPAVAAQKEPLSSATFNFNQLPVQVHDHVEIRSILKGSLATGESIEVHETTLPPNGAPHPPHRHKHSEMWLIREGTVQITINGVEHVLNPGGLGFVQSNDEHGIRNIGNSSATYYVVAIGPGAGA